MIRLAPDPDQADRTGAVRRTYRAELLGNSRDCVVPRNPLETPVGATTQGVLDTLVVMRIARHGKSLVADVTRRDRVLVVPPHGGDAAAADVDTQATIVAAEHADRCQPVGVLADGFPGNRRIDADSHYRSPNFFEFFAQVPEVTAFLSSTRSHGLGEEEHHHRSRLQQIRETNFFAELIGGFEISRCVTYLHRCILCTEEPTICHHARTSNPR